MPTESKKRDPTQTTTLRRKFSGKMYKRFRQIKGLIRKSIVDRDALGIGRDAPQRTRPIMDGVVNAEPLREYEFSQNPNKLDSFKEWLEKTTSEVVIGQEGRWTDEYIEKAYNRGVAQAETKLNGAGVAIDEIPPQQFVSMPTNQDTLRRLYTRTFSELENINNTMSTQIGRELSGGMADGVGPVEMASRINDRVDKIGITRGRLIARTETIRAHHEATLDRFKMAGVRNVETQAEWVTAGDARVCPRCIGQEGQVRTIKEQRGLIPLHPNCRCSVLPVTDDFGPRSDG